MHGLSFSIELWLPDSVSDDDAQKIVTACVAAGLMEAAAHATEAEQADCGYSVEVEAPARLQ